MMKEEEKIEKKEKTEEKPKEKKKLTFNRIHIAMLSVSATVLVFILAFSCYGCSYQPVTPPSPEEAKVTLETLYNTTWILDDTMGVPTLSELGNQAVERFVIDEKRVDSEETNTTMFLKNSPPLRIELLYKEGYGFTIKSGSKTFAVKILYSASKDGKSETLTMIGNESKTHCYYLKK